MKRIVLQILLAISGLLMFFRFGGPALIFGATGPGPFGNRWLTQGTNATLLLDADLRFFGAMMLGLGAIFFWMIARIEKSGPLIYILSVAVALGAAARIYARITYGGAGTAGTIPIVIETMLPFFLILLRYSVGKDTLKVLK
jgi:hypothetical protein